MVFSTSLGVSKSSYKPTQNIGSSNRSSQTPGNPSKVDNQPYTFKDNPERFYKDITKVLIENNYDPLHPTNYSKIFKEIKSELKKNGCTDVDDFTINYFMKSLQLNAMGTSWQEVQAQGAAEGFQQIAMGVVEIAGGIAANQGLSKSKVNTFKNEIYEEYGIEGTGKAIGNSTEITNLLDNMPELTGSTRDKLLSVIQNSKLRNIVGELYRPGATVGDGGTAAILKQEFSQGSSTHLIKAQERLTQLNNLAKSEKLGLNDLDILDALKNDLNDAINLFK